MAKEKFIIIQETIKKYRLKNKIGFLCKLAGVSRSGYYNYFLPRSISTRNGQDSKDFESYTNILAAYNFKKRSKGAKQIKMTLENEFSINYNLKRIRRIMKKYNIVCPHRKANPYRRMMKATKEHTVLPNLLNREFKHLEEIYIQFNNDHPEDFGGHYLSVSDVVVLHQNGTTTTHYVDSTGFSDVTQTFQRENPLETAEKSTEQNYNMIDEQINNTPTVDELEARVKAGEQISLTELAEAVKQDKAATKAKKPGRKPSIRKQLQEDKEKAKAAPKKSATRSKKTELERS